MTCIAMTQVLNRPVRWTPLMRTKTGRFVVLLRFFVVARHCCLSFGEAGVSKCGVTA